MMCKITDCDKKVRTLGFCATHYMRLWRGAKVDAPLYRRGTHKVCTVEWCDKPILARHLCIGHYERLREGRDLDAPFRDNWKGGITSDNRLQRQVFRKTLLQKILVRDNFTCQFCDTSGDYMHVDHIKSWADFPELRFNESNCRTLCRVCHYYITFKRKMPKKSRWGMYGLKITKETI